MRGKGLAGSFRLSRPKAESARRLRRVARHSPSLQSPSHALDLNLALTPRPMSPPDVHAIAKTREMNLALLLGGKPICSGHHF